MKKIGLDLDGVLSPDFVEPKGGFTSKDIQVMLDARKMIKPLWDPSLLCCELIFRSSLNVDFVIVTSRIASDKAQTLAWLEEWLALHESNLFYMGEDKPVSDEVAAGFKGRVCTEQRLDVFIESSKQQAELIKKLAPNTKVLTFNNVIRESFMRILGL